MRRGAERGDRAEKEEARHEGGPKGEETAEKTGGC
jgi:hypothetical protein